MVCTIATTFPGGGMALGVSKQQEGLCHMEFIEVKRGKTDLYNFLKTVEKKELVKLLRVVEIQLMTCTSVGCKISIGIFLAVRTTSRYSTTFQLLGNNKTS